MIDDPQIAMPHSLGCEKALISMLLQNNLVYYPRFIEKGMKFEMFYQPSHLKIASIILEYCNSGQQIEMVMFMQKLINKSMLDDLGGPAAVTELFGYAMVSSSFDYYCDEVKAKFIERELHLMSHKIQQSDIQNKEDIQVLLGESESKLSELQSTLHPMAAKSVRMALESVLENFKELIATDDPKSLYGLLTGFEKTDNLLMGLQPTNLYVIGARPSMGKTAFLANIVQNICVNQGNPTLIFSLEMSIEQIVKRIAYSLAKISYHRLTSRGADRYVPSKAELIRMKDALTKCEQAPLYVDDSSGISIDYMMATARKHKRDYGIKFLCIDYLQLMKSNSKKASQSKVVEIGEISGACKQIAKELNVSVVVLSQLSRNTVSGGKATKPKMSDLRSSGDIEQDADVIGLLHRYDYEGQGDEKDKGRAEINWTKNRHGPTGSVELVWHPEYTQFEEKVNMY